jgi:hypothetical protein
MTTLDKLQSHTIADIQWLSLRTYLDGHLMTVEKEPRAGQRLKDPMRNAIVSPTTTQHHVVFSEQAIIGWK